MKKKEELKFPEGVGIDRRMCKARGHLCLSAVNRDIRLVFKNRCVFFFFFFLCGNSTVNDFASAFKLMRTDTTLDLTAVAKRPLAVFSTRRLRVQNRYYSD